jgi:hypothetical protein
LSQSGRGKKDGLRDRNVWRKAAEMAENSRFLLLATFSLADFAAHGSVYNGSFGN